MYSEEGLRVWIAYNIVPGKLIQWEKLDFQPNTENLRVSAIDYDTNGEKARGPRLLQNKQLRLALAIHQVLRNPPQMNQMLVSIPFLKKNALNAFNGSPHFNGT